MNQRAPNPFIGREREIDIYEQWLMDPNAPRILYFYDAAPEPDKKGGVGKTRLLQECIKLTKEKHQAQRIVIINIDFFGIIDRNGRAIAERVYSQLKDTYTGWSADSFDKALKEHQQTTKKDDKNNADPAEIRKKLSEALISDLHNLDAYLRETYPAMQHTVLLVLDTFEFINDSPSVAVFSPKQTFPDDYHFDRIRFLMAGRNAINWAQPNWQGREHEVQSVELKPFTRDETVDYMQSYDIRLELGSPEAAILWELTSGRPILLGLVKDLLGYNTVNLEDLLSVPRAEFEAHLVSQINNIDKPVNWLLLFMAHAYHRFNFSLLEWILKKSRLRTLVGKVDRRQLNTLPHFSFVRRVTDESDDFTLHDEMQPLIMKHCWQKLANNESLLHEVSRCVIEFYENALEQERDDLIRHSYTVQILYHKAFLDIKDGLDYFTKRFDEAIDLWQNAYARALLQEIQKFADSLSLDQHADLVMEEARLFLKEENREMALANYNQLLDEADVGWIEAHRADIHYNLGESHLAMTKLEEASREFKTALALERERNNQKKIADILTYLGYISRRQGQFDRAVEHYEESINIYRELGRQPAYLRELANNFNNLSYVYCLQGKTDEASVCCQRGLHIRERLSRHNEVSEVAVGLSHSTLGFIYLHEGDYVNAEHHLERALDAFTRTNNKKGLAIYHNRLGMLLMKSGKGDDALSQFKIAFKEAADIDEEVQITSLNMQGHIHIWRKEYVDARNILEQAIEQAIHAHDSYQEAESRIDLAHVLVYLQEYELYGQELEQASAIVEQLHYNNLLGEIEKLQGEYYYQQQKYEDAFFYYAKMVHSMIQYSLFEYQKIIHVLRDNLLELLKTDNSAEVANVLVVLRSYWKKHQLGDKYPEFLKVCDDIDKTHL